MELLRQRFTTSLEDALDQGPYDFVIVGAGFFGCFVASKLYQLSHPKKPKVLILEAGDLWLPGHVKQYPFLTPKDLHRIPGVTAQGKVFYGPQDAWIAEKGYRQTTMVGGHSTQWDLWAPRTQPEDFADWPTRIADEVVDAMPAMELEMGLRPARPFFKGVLQDQLQVQLNRHLDQFSEFDEIRPGPFAAQGHAEQSGSLAAGPFCPLSMLLETMANDTEGHVKLVTGCRVRRFEISDQRVIGLAVRDNRQNRFAEIKIGNRTQVITTAGIRQSTRLFLESLSPRGRGYEQIGRNLNGHMKSEFHVRFPKSVLSLPDAQLLPQAALETHGADSCMQIFAVGGRHESGRPHFAEPHFEQDRVKQHSVLGDQNMLTLTLVSYTGIGGDNNRILMEKIANQDVANVQAYYRLNKNDLDNWQRHDVLAIKFLQSLIRNHGKKDELNKVEWKVGQQWLSTPPQSASQVRSPINSVGFECGTLRFSDDPDTGVLNQFGRSNGFANLYCLDSAAIPSTGAGSPVLPTLTWARIATQKLVQQWYKHAMSRPASINGKIFA